MHRACVKEACNDATALSVREKTREEKIENNKNLVDRIEKLRMKENKRAQEITAQEIIKQKTEESEVVGQEKTEQKTAAPEVKTQENTEIRFTPAQQACIDERGKDILVSAAAGSGKTAVLVERIIQLILDTQNPVDIDELLVATFT